MVNRDGIVKQAGLCKYPDRRFLEDGKITDLATYTLGVCLLEGRPVRKAICSNFTYIQSCIFDSKKSALAHINHLINDSKRVIEDMRDKLDSLKEEFDELFKTVINY